MCLPQQRIAGLKTLHIYDSALSTYLEAAPPLLGYRREDEKEKGNYTKAFFSTEIRLLRCISLCWHEYTKQANEH
jgi:hypothetical protein